MRYDVVSLHRYHFDGKDVLPITDWVCPAARVFFVLVFFLIVVVVTIVIVVGIRCLIGTPLAPMFLNLIAERPDTSDECREAVCRLNVAECLQQAEWVCPDIGGISTGTKALGSQASELAVDKSILGGMGRRCELLHELGEVNENG